MIKNLHSLHYQHARSKVKEKYKTIMDKIYTCKGDYF